MSMRLSKMMLMEFLVALLCLLVCSQSSSLWASVLIVLTSVTAMLSFGKNASAGSLMAFILVLVFVGGIMVLLTSVSSSVHQEQAVIPTSLSLTMMIFGLKGLMPEQNLDFSHMLSLNWLSALNSIGAFLLCLMILGLVTMSSLIMEYKGAIRVI